MAEALGQRQLLPPGEILRRGIPGQGVVLRRGLKILADGENVAAGRQNVVHQAVDLLLRLPQAHHEAGFGQQGGVLLLAVPQLFLSFPAETRQHGWLVCKYMYMKRLHMRRRLSKIRKSSAIGKEDRYERLRPQARFAAQPPKAALSAEITHQGCLSFAITGFSELSKF